MSALAGLFCPECEKSYDSERLQTYCLDCDSPLLARYDLAQAGRRPEGGWDCSGVWRWAALLPVRDPDCRLSLGEGGTPILHAPTLARELGMSGIMIKDEGGNPGGTFKARGFAVAVSRALELGVRDFVLPTAGNAGGALALYAARAGVRARIYMPSDAPAAHRAEIAAAHADLELVDGLIDEAARRAAEVAGLNGSFDMSTFKEPYRVEGKKTMGFELVEQLGWAFPDVIIYPTGGGTGLVGMWKAFSEMESLGWVSGRRPRMVSVQPEGCAPVVRAVEQGMDRISPWSGATTIAHGLRVPAVFADRLVLSAIRGSRGTAIAVSDDEIKEARTDLAVKEGILPCLEGAAPLAGLRRLRAQGWIEAGEQVLLFMTGTGLKDLI
jgi:threonine synthase